MKVTNIDANHTSSQYHIAETPKERQPKIVTKKAAGGGLGSICKDHSKVTMSKYD